MSREPDPYRNDEDDAQEYAPQSIFAAGWFRAVLVLTVLAIVVVVSLPYLLNWFEPTPPSVPPPPVAGVTTPAAPPVQATAPAPGTPAATPKAEADKPPTLPAEAKAPATAKAPPAADKPAPAPRPAPRARGGEPEPRQEAKASMPARPTAKAEAVAKREYRVQLGLFKDAKNAEALAKAVRDDGFTVEVDRVTRAPDGQAGTYHVVRTGTFPDLAGATKARNALRAKGHQGFITGAGAP